ncbi:hypothetical protein G7Z17_g2166 [Cylindrodendrum hubeiense]|uniref:NADH:flavin oxidoreductase/NADH oxidase N-terminal domain-containing protein n=1 Tax=Cylindrodendrum hubeiense TaxID=595255 RepID=A0A9P5LEQ1_9HYPO|nr:hypothetical protein G7Z17_g2166 [Cylindrodendrum hubeiense]
MESALFKPLQVGRVTLAHRIVMAPLTRLRADANNVQLPMAVEYYKQRASVPGTLIIAEATQISPAHAGFGNAPGIWNDDQIASFRRITDIIHAKSCSVFCQLFAPGRAADTQELEKTGHSFFSSSPVAMTYGSDTPREMAAAEIESAIADFAQAAKNAVSAGFDGVEIHGANGYLVDQFLQDTCNRRKDDWGGSVENRAEFALRVAAAVVDAIGADRVGFRISPWSTFQGMKMADAEPQFVYLVSKLKDMKLAYLHIIESRVMNNIDVEKVEGIEFLLDIWRGTSPILVAGGFSPDSARKAVDEEYQQYGDVAVVFGRHFIANPDLPLRVKNGLPLNKYDRSTFYTPMSETGYLDYPFSPIYEEGEEIVY